MNSRMRPLSDLFIKPIANLVYVLFVGLGFLYAAEHTAEQFSDFKETRFYRDYHGLTPFHSVKVYDVQILEDRLITFGEMEKRRCDFVELTGWALFSDAPSVRVPVDTSIEDAMGVTGNRIPFGSAETWGPWSLQYPLTHPTPAGWRVDAGHLCPIFDEKGQPAINQATGEPRLKFETNTFATGLWAEMLD
jgi:hypothetical protein